MIYTKEQYESVLAAKKLTPKSEDQVHSELIEIRTMLVDNLRPLVSEEVAGLIDRYAALVTADLARLKDDVDIDTSKWQSLLNDAHVSRERYFDANDLENGYVAAAVKAACYSHGYDGYVLYVKSFWKIREENAASAITSEGEA